MRGLEAAWNTYVGVPLRRTLPASYWAHQDAVGPHGTEQYRNLDEWSYQFLEAIQRYTTRIDTVLDVGCNHGRHLRALWRRGYRRLTGVDVVATTTSRYFRGLRGTFQDLLPACRDQSYDAVVSYGATVELVPPTFPIVWHLSRIAKLVIVLCIQEYGHAYPRLWTREFAWAGWRVVERSPCGQNMLLVFQRMQHVDRRYADRRAD